MSALWKELGIILAALLLIAAATSRFGDRSVLTSPPEAVAEEFGAKLLHGRLGPARSHLAESLAGDVTADSLRIVAARLGRGRDVTTVEGEPGAATERTARPSVVVIGARADTLATEVPMVWERGAWKVAALPAPQ